MLVWKPLLFVFPAGLLLGMVGGHLAKPVMAQRVSDESWQSMFQTRADRYGLSTAYPEPQAEDLAYVGGYSYAPDLSDTSMVAWSPPDYFHYRDVPLPTVAELDARQAALLADPEVQFRSRQPEPGDAAEQVANDARSAAQDSPQPAVQSQPMASASAGEVALGSEPRTAGGELPAIW